MGLQENWIEQRKEKEVDGYGDRPFRVSPVFIHFVESDNQRCPSLLDDVDTLDRLSFHTFVSRHHQNTQICRRCPSLPHRRERGVAWGVDEGQPLILSGKEKAPCRDSLSDSSSFGLRHSRAVGRRKRKIMDGGQRK